MKYKWRLPESNGVTSRAILDATEGRPLLARILQQRGHTDPEEIRAFLFADTYTPADASEMPGLTKGVKRIEGAIANQERILVWGDFDVDGQTSTSLLYAGLKQLGAQVEYHIPIREKESHGIRPEFLKPYLDDGIHIVLSCDTGIAAHDAIVSANSYGVDVIVTDHHDCPETLPPAYALINPKLFNEAHPLSSLPGVGVAYKFIEALFERAGRLEEAKSFLDLVALGIVADLAILTEDTRYLLQLGLDTLRETKRVGLIQLMENANVIPQHLIDEHIGFQIGPRLNAVGRLADANISVPLLTTTDPTRAKEIADELERLNEERRFQTELVYESAIEQVNKDPSLLQYAVLVLAHSTWHQGVIGIVASRLVEAFGRPAILLATPEGKLARGSARSVEGVHITQAIASQEELLSGYGGHPMAAGLAMDPAYLDRFRRGVSKAVVDQRTGEEVEPAIDIDAVVSLKDLNEDLVDELELLAPFGPGNPPVNLLCKKLNVVGQVIIGKDKSHKKLVVQEEGEEGDREQKEILWWNSAELTVPDGFIDAVVRVRPGFFRGERQLTITLQDVRLSGVRVEHEQQQKTIQITDYREEKEPNKVLQELLNADSSLQVWAEGGSIPGSAVSRLDLKEASSLAIWTMPPNQEVLTAIIHRVKPEYVYMFGVDPEMDTVPQFIKRFMGVIKYTLSNYSGITQLDTLASTMTHGQHTIKAALQLLPGVGLKTRISSSGTVEITHRPGKVDGLSRDNLTFALNEARSFQLY